MKNILSICAVAFMILSLASCANNGNDSFQSKVNLLVNDKLETQKETLATECNTNMDNAIAARVDAAKAKRKASASKPKTAVAAPVTTTPVYVPPTTTTYTPPTSTTTTTTTTTVPKTTLETKRDKIKGNTTTGQTRTTQDGKTVQDAKTTGAKRDKIRGKIKRATGGGN